MKRSVVFSLWHLMRCFIDLYSSSFILKQVPLSDELDRVGQLAVELNIAVRLLVSIKVSISRSSSLFLNCNLQSQENEALLNQHREHRIMWCLDNGFEYLEIDSSNPTQSRSHGVSDWLADELFTGHNLREKDGLPRLIEALNSNMWSNMERVGM
jgi:hypothetical protein